MNTVVSAPMNTHNQEAWLVLSPMASKTLQGVSSMCRCPEVALRARIRLVERGGERRARSDDPHHGAGRDIEPVVGQCGHDALERSAEHVLLDEQMGQEHRGEQALADHLGHDGGDGHPWDRAPAATPVGRPVMDDAHETHLPVDLFGGLLVEGVVGRPALRADPLLLRDVVDALFGLELGVVTPSVSLAAGLLAPPTLGGTRRLRGSATMVVISGPRVPLLLLA